MTEAIVQRRVRAEYDNGTVEEWWSPLFVTETGLERVYDHAPDWRDVARAQEARDDLRQIMRERRS